MTTFLEYLLTKYLGKPACVRGNGVSYWDCPVCSHRSFHTMPIKRQFKHRATCWNVDCGFRGDAADMLKEFHLGENWIGRRARLEQLQREWEEQNRGLVPGRGVRREADRVQKNLEKTSLRGLVKR